uniref:Uncharacterized protein n=1 Tax=Oryza sativa subsp. japonica TaxID=39947 RepID=Q69NG4_ORYSJ|nr:hypothetical protein [Oryza sativa Japonica Group]
MPGSYRDEIPLSRRAEQRGEGGRLRRLSTRAKEEGLLSGRRTWPSATSFGETGSPCPDKLSSEEEVAACRHKKAPLEEEEETRKKKAWASGFRSGMMRATNRSPTRRPPMESTSIAAGGIDNRSPPVSPSTRLDRTDGETGTATCSSSKQA